MLPLELFDEAQAPPNMLAVERDDTPETSGGVIILPDTWREGVKAPEATIHSIGMGVDGFREGERVVLSVGVTKQVAFGDRDERILYICSPAQILGKLPQGRTERGAPGDRPYSSEADETAREGLADMGRQTPRTQ